MKLFDKEIWEERLKTIEGHLAKLLTPKKLAIFSTIVYVLSLIPLLWIAWYNYPSADDYSIGSNCHRIWVETHSLWQTIGQGIIRAVDDWVNWMGYFTSNFLMAMPPSTFGERWYVLTTWIMLGILSGSMIYLFHSIFVKAFGADKYVTHSIVMVILFASVQCMCPAGRVEAFYWYSGAANYILVHGLSLFFYGLLISAYYDTGKKRIWDLTVASFLGFLTGGGNQMTALNVAVVVLIGIVGLSVRKKWSHCRAIGVPICIFYLGFLLNVAAPGNWVRAEGASGMNPVKAVIVSFYECLDRVIGEWTTWPVVVLMILLVPLFWSIAGNVNFQYRYPVVVVLFGYCLVSAMMTPPLFAVGNMEAGRLQALTYLMYILILSLCVGYVTGWVRRKINERSLNTMADKCFTASQNWCLLVCILLMMFGSIISIVPEPHYFTFSSALVDLCNGNAKVYGETLEKRAELFQSGEQGIIEVEPLSVQPVLLFFSDIKEDSEDWENRGVARFYALDGVKLKDE